ncbi:MAG: hypothetical protein NC250_06175 [Alistipes senegalensis]|nr:hypothetical protein [Bacteroides cellulosilyticus]MCM1352301.1 hypothetical protein [Alistipes senegalensis]
MRILHLLFFLFSLSVVPLRAADSGVAWLGRLQAAVDALGAYEVRFDLSTTDGYAVQGAYRVEDDSYCITMPAVRVFCDGKARYEVNDDKREVVVDAVDTRSHNLLDNPARAFDFVGEQYDAQVVAEQADRITLRLTPRGEESLTTIELTLDKGSALPVSVVYGAEDLRITITIRSFEKSAAPFPVFRASDYSDYELIDFR